MVVNKDGSGDHGQTVRPEDVTRNPVKAPLSVAKKKKKLAPMRDERFFRRLRGPWVADERRRKQRVRGGKGCAGERGAYADDGESGVQRAHSLTLL